MPAALRLMVCAFLAALDVRRHSRSCAKLLAFAAMRQSSIRSYGTFGERGRSIVVTYSQTPFLADKRVHDEDNHAKENLDRYRSRPHDGCDKPFGHRRWPPCPTGTARGGSPNPAASRCSWIDDVVPGAGGGPGWNQILRSSLVLSRLIAYCLRPVATFVREMETTVNEKPDARNASLKKGTRLCDAQVRKCSAAVA